MSQGWGARMPPGSQDEDGALRSVTEGSRANSWGVVATLRIANRIVANNIVGVGLM